MHIKDFGGWGVEKELIHTNEDNKWCNERDIWWCKLGLNIGYEQDGKGEDFLRPVLVVKKFNKFVCLVVPLSTKSKKGKYYVAFKNEHGLDVVAIISQVRLVDTKRLFKKQEKVSNEVFAEIKKAITQLFV